MFFRKGIEFDPFLHRVHERSLNLIEYDNSERKDECGKACCVAERSPAEFSDTEHSELECFHDAGERVCLHKHLEARVFNGAERVNHRGCIHPKLYDKREQKCEIAIFGGETAEQYAKAEREGCNKEDEHGREQQIDVRVYGSAGKDKVICKDNQE